MTSDNQPTRPSLLAPFVQDDLDQIGLAIQELDDLTGHKPDGFAMKAQEALSRIAHILGGEIDEGE